MVYSRPLSGSLTSAQSSQGFSDPIVPRVTSLAGQCGFHNRWPEEMVGRELQQVIWASVKFLFA